MAIGGNNSVFFRVVTSEMWAWIMHILTSLRGLSIFIQEEDMKLGGNSGRGDKGEDGGEVMGWIGSKHL